MAHGFWHERWQKQEIGFHQQTGNAALRDAFERLAPAAGARVFVPLCGKSVDMAWLHARDCEVLGVELSDSALLSFFTEQELQPRDSATGDGLQRYAAARYVLYAGDFFDVGTHHLGRLDAVCDRAALVALPEDTRPRYASRLLDLADSAPIVLITLDYAQHEMSGPPFAVSDTEVQTLFEERRRVQRVASREVLGEESGLRKRGLSSLRETAWLLHSDR